MYPPILDFGFDVNQTTGSLQCSRVEPIILRSCSIYKPRWRLQDFAGI